MAQIIPSDGIKHETSKCVNTIFPRGKSRGHDVDLLLSHPDEGHEEGFLLRLLHRLATTGIIIYGNYERSTFTPDAYRSNNKAVYLQSTLDHYEKWIGVIKVNKNIHKTADDQHHKAMKSVTASSSRKRSLDVDSSYDSTPDFVESNLKDRKKRRNSHGSQSMSSSSAGQNACKDEGLDGCEVRISGNDDTLPSSSQGDTHNRPSSQDVQNAMLPPSVSMNRQSSISGSLDSSNVTYTINRRRSYDEFKTEASEDRDWLARRVDLIVVPASQYYYAVVGWTGSKMFNRAARNYASKERNASLTSHGLFDNKTVGARQG